MIIYPIHGKYKTKKDFDVSVIIPMYKSKKVILEQIRRWPTTDKGISVEIIYVDDKCPEHSSQSVMSGWKERSDKEYFNVKLILNQNNKGFGEACNTGAHYANGKYLIFLNADTLPEPNWIKPIYDIFERDKNVGIVGNLQLKEGGELHGTIDSAGSQWWWGEANFLHIGRHILDGKILDTPLFPEELPQHLNCESDREMVTGCCLSIRKNLFKYIGGFNPAYRIGYWEDSELCLNVRELGYRVVFTPKSIIWHKLSHAKVGKHVYHDINKQYFMNKWDASGKLDSLVNSPRPIKRNKVKKILIKRDAANGDVLVAAGVSHALKQKYPDAEIHFCTGCSKVLLENPYIDKIIDQFEAFSNLHKYQRVIELDGAYERRPNVHIVQAYADEAGIKVEDMKYYVHCANEILEYQLPKDYIVIHAGVTNWVGRNWNTKGFEDVAQKLLDKGENVICIGKGADRLVPCTLDLRSSITFFEMNKVIQDAKMFIGIDSMPMHVAQILDVPGVCFFGSIDSTYRIYNTKMKAVHANRKEVPCLGCHHRRLPPCTTLQICETGNLDCENKVETEIMQLAISLKLNRIKNAT